MLSAGEWLALLPGGDEWQDKRRVQLMLKDIK